jgi:hypothetical protein
MKKFSQFPSERFLNRVNGLRSLLLALDGYDERSDERIRGMRVVFPGVRASSRMFLDMRKFTQSQINSIIKHGERLGLVKEFFMNPYFLGSGEHFVALTKKGVSIIDRTST